MAYKIYEAESAVTAAEAALRDLNGKMQSYEADIAKARRTVSKGLEDMGETRNAANVAAADVAAAQRAVDAAKSKLEEKLMEQHKITIRLKAIEADVERARGVVTAKTKEQEGSAVEMVKRKLEVEKAQAKAMKAAQGLSLPSLPPQLR